MNRSRRNSPFACRMVSMADCGRGQGSAMNSLRSAWTASSPGPSDPRRQAKGEPESRHSASDILSIELVHNTGQLTFQRLYPHGFTEYVTERIEKEAADASNPGYKPDTSQHQHHKQSVPSVRSRILRVECFRFPTSAF